MAAKPTKKAPRAAAKPRRAVASTRKPAAEAVQPEPTAREARLARRRERTKEELVQAARRVLLQKGLAAATLDAIAEEAGITKAAIYYYYPSKDALFFELIYETYSEHAHKIDSAVSQTTTGAEALAALIRETVTHFAASMDDFRIAFLQNQVAGPGNVKIAAEQLTRIRPLNNLTFSATEQRVTADREAHAPAADVRPRLLTFLAHVSAIGLLTMKGMVESVGDPLLYSDDELIDALAKVFAAAG